MAAKHEKSADADEPISQHSSGRDPRYEEPFGWWGYHWTPPEPKSLVWLIESGSLDPLLAAFLSLAVENRRTIVVIAGPQQAGKTTLLTALLDFLPQSTRPIYLRGWYERFAFLETVPPDQAYLLCNEISAHLPTYLWGQGVRRVFQAGMDGYPFLTTMHATTTEEALDLLQRYPLEVPADHMRAIDVIVSLDIGYINTRLARRVMSVDVIDPEPTPYRVVRLSERALLRGSLEHRLGRLVATVARWAECSDTDASRILSQRERMLSMLLEQGKLSPEDLRRQLRGDSQ